MTLKSVAGGYLFQTPRQRQGLKPRRPQGRHQTRADRRKELDDLLFAFISVQTREIQRHRLRQGWRHGGRRRRPDEPPRFSSRIAAIRAAEVGRDRQAGCKVSPADRQRRRLGRLLPLRRRPAGRRRSGRHRHHPARRFDARQGSDRGRRRGRPRHGLHRDAPLPPLAIRRKWAIRSRPQFINWARLLMISVTSRVSRFISTMSSSIRT